MRISFLLTPVNPSETPAQGNRGLNAQRIGWRWAKRQANASGVLKGA